MDQNSLYREEDEHSSCGVGFVVDLDGKASRRVVQNGIDAPERLLPILGPQAVMGGVAQISASIVEPGVIRQVGTFTSVLF